MSKTCNMMNVLNKSKDFYKNAKCDDCPLAFLCTATHFLHHCTSVFIAAVLSGIIDLDGKPIDEDKQ